jgi:hypothetical protein
MAPRETNEKLFVEFAEKWCLGEVKKLELIE